MTQELKMQNKANSKLIDNRNYIIDIMRALACIIVFIDHFTVGLFPFLHDSSVLGTKWNMLRHGTPFNMIFNGNIAVHYFFVVSAYLTYNKYIDDDKDIDIISFVGHKIIKLLKIIIPAEILVFLLANLGLYFCKDVYAINNTLIEIVGWGPDTVSIFQLIKETIRNLVYDANGLLTPLWTMHNLLLGDVIVAVFATVLRGKKNRFFSIACMIPLVLWINKDIGSFFIGMMVFEIVNGEYREVVEKLLQNRRTSVLKRLICFICKICYISIAVFTLTFDFNAIGMYSVLPENTGYGYFLHAVGVGMVMICVLMKYEGHKKRSKSYSKVLLSIGKYSAYIYAFHLQIILSVGCKIYLYLYNKTNMFVLFCGTFCVTFGASILIAKLWVSLINSDFFNRLEIAAIDYCRVKIKKLLINCRFQRP